MLVVSVVRFVLNIKSFANMIPAYDSRSHMTPPLCAVAERGIVQGFFKHNLTQGGESPLYKKPGQGRVFDIRWVSINPFPFRAFHRGRQASWVYLFQEDQLPNIQWSATWLRYWLRFEAHCGSLWPGRQYRTQPC